MKVRCDYAARLVLSLVFVALPVMRGFAESITVGVAANAVPVMREIAVGFERETSISVTISSGATGMLARQATEGAPFDLLILADMKTVEALGDKGIIQQDSISPYARGRLVLWSPRQTFRIRHLEDLGATTGSQPRLAIANPRSAPYGAAAKQALERAGVWSRVEKSIIYSEDVTQALRYAETGNVDASFVPYALVLQKAPPAWPVPENLYDPIIQGLAITAAGKHQDGAKTLRRFILGPVGQEIFRQHGYQKP